MPPVLRSSFNFLKLRVIEKIFLTQYVSRFSVKSRLVYCVISGGLSCVRSCADTKIKSALRGMRVDRDIIGPSNIARRYAVRNTGARASIFLHCVSVYSSVVYDKQLRRVYVALCKLSDELPYEYRPEALGVKR